jgi:osmotically-inducible protein OsmY
MKIKSVLLGMGLAVSLVACGPKDADIQKEISAKLGDRPEVQVTVQDGVATISGICKDDAFKQDVANSIKEIKGVKSVVNNCQIVAPEETAPAAVIITPDTELDKSLHKVIESYDGVSATVVGGVVTLTGEIKRSQLPNLIKSVQELKPKKVDNKLIIK